jgi:antitoxin MazE
MKTSVQKWGNSLAVRIPKSLAVEAKLRKGTSMQLSLERGRLVFTPEIKKQLSLKTLLAKVKPGSLHPETDWGPDEGRERA